MDTTDPKIIFDAEGICNHCNQFAERAPREWFPNDEGKRRWSTLVDLMKKNGEGKYGPNDYHVIEELEESIESYIKNALRYIGINRSVVNVMEDDSDAGN